MAKDLFNRYIWLVDTIYRAEKISLEEINEKWLGGEMSEGEEIPLRTFHNHRKAIEKLFDINIECDRRNGYTYCIENKDDIKQGRVRSWLFNTFAVNNLINESHKLKHRILFEQIPSGQKYLTPIIEAMRDGTMLEVTYQSFWREESRTFEIAPYCVKVFKQRWYVVAQNPHDNKIKIYGLDRIQKIRATDTKFKVPKDFSPENYFNNSFGIINEDGSKPCKVQIRVSAGQSNYLRSLPLHHSQEEIKQNEDYSTFEYFIKPTYDFRKELLSMGNEVEVMAPEWFRKEVAEIVESTKCLYRELP